MKIVVLIKRVPDTETKVKFKEDQKSLDTTGVNFILNPYDEFAIEEALLLKEKHGGEVIIVSVGNKDASKEIRTALAMGADSGILFETEVPFADVASLATGLAGKLQELGPDLILLGKQAVDDDNAALAPYLAEKLNLPSATVVVKLEVLDDNKLQLEREIEGGREEVSLQLPAVVSCQKGLNTPRYASMKGIMMAKKKKIEEVPIELGAPLVSVTKLELPQARPEGRILGEGVEAIPALVDALSNEAKVI